MKSLIVASLTLISFNVFAGGVQTVPGFEGGTDQKQVVLEVGKQFFLARLVGEGGADSKPVQKVIFMAKAIEGEGGVETIFPKAVMRVTSAALIAESSTAALIELNNSEIFVEVDKRELSKSDELFKKIETAQ